MMTLSILANYILVINHKTTFKDLLSTKDSKARSTHILLAVILERWGAFQLKSHCVSHLTGVTEVNIFVNSH